MNENDSELLNGLRALAADGPQEAAGHIEERLKAEFRRRNRRHRLAAWSPALGVAAAAAIALLLWPHSEKPKLTPAPAAVVSQSVVAQAAPVADDDADTSFYPLPEADSLPALENAMVVRVQLPVSSLQLMGVPVTEERAGASVQAELLLGQDGLARGVRLAQ